MSGTSIFHFPGLNTRNTQLRRNSQLATRDLELSIRNSTTRKLPSPFLNLVQFLFLNLSCWGTWYSIKLKKIKVPLQDFIVNNSLFRFVRVKLKLNCFLQRHEFCYSNNGFFHIRCHLKLTKICDKIRWAAAVRAVYFILTRPIIETGAAVRHTR